MMKKKRIVLGISGGIAAFKSASVASQLTQRGYDVRVIMTQSATKFITPLTLQTLSQHTVAVDTFDEHEPKVVQHIDLADHADLVLLAPATANIIGKLALGLGDDMLSTTLLATQAPILIAPAMNVHMYENPVVQKNMQLLKNQGCYFIAPGEGQLACGYVGQGRMAEPENIVNWVERFFTSKKLLSGKRVLITAGPTREQMDPVRYFSNYSSGKMGFALAEAAKEAGAEVILVSGPVSQSTPTGVNRIDVKSTEEMKEVVLSYLPQADIIIKAAAVADYRPKQIWEQKMKKSADEITIVLEKTPDIAAEIGKRKQAHQFFVGFAAETEQVAYHAQSKLERKRMNLIVANDVSQPGAGFGIDTNIVTIFDRQGEVVSLPQMNKIEVARRLIHLIGERIDAY
ncbi:bifunctional phosphopantothenoylcysteine decarboxylase/phosphopantothenate--cysteine ligase CoaBC [Hazenella coriacea]|uniref:Coenzyme A biosynthesis bifunctional protein CoaBC n=1 Tax=Hazenella coriacea TaxID=1179467 RepID=A0A4R3L0P1_9BACL|nr:bifunctional phosphopantothenoylcysteine decarboxylase/phosphopantothenate--cysteine ligase CoaBC [Hazenella coriacea]TCS93071.1 phosphopantothenoylcysteine decarboxylase/phosphopantothenate--cysteine ligase [Hazenella coriacea]